MRICSAKEKVKDEATVGSLKVTDANSGSMTTHNAEDKIKMDAHPFVGSDAATNILPADGDAVENWRGLAVPPKKRKRTSYLSSCTEWLHADETFGAKRVKVGLLKNGNLHQPIRLGESTISVLNTCAFDAFFQCLCCAFCDSSTFQNAVLKDSENPVLQLVKAIATDGVTQQTYRRRAELLSVMFEAVSLRSAAIQIDAQCNISAVIAKTMRNISSVYFTKHCSSQHCYLSKGMTREVPFVSPAISVLKESGMAHLGTAVEAGLGLPESTCLRPLSNPSLCPSEFKTEDSTTGNELCAGTVTHSYNIGDIVWIDTDLANQTEFPLNEFPSNLVLQGKSFTLRALIAFHGKMTTDGLGHYTAYCRRAPCVWECYDDLGNGVTGASEKKKIQPHAVLYTV